MKDSIAELESKVKNCHNTNTIFDTRNYVLLDDVRKLLAAINYTRCSTELPVKDAKLLYELLPEWAKNAPSGLDPTFYGTLTQEGDQAIVNKVNTILKKAIT